MSIQRVLFVLTSALEITSQADALGALCPSVSLRTKWALRWWHQRSCGEEEQVVAEEPCTDSAWDPGPLDVVLEGSRCRALLLEIVKRAAHDWILYRLQADLELRQLADDAYIWLFEEGPGHKNWESRKGTEAELTSFLAICEATDLSPHKVRAAVRCMTPQGITRAGRPAEVRRPKKEQQLDGIEDYSLPDGLELVTLEEAEDQYGVCITYESVCA